MYYNNGRYFYNDPSRKPKVEVKPIEYACKDEVDYLKQIVKRHDVDMTHCLSAIDINRNDCEQMYQTIDSIKYDIQNLKSYVDYLHSCIKNAQTGTRRKRRVTICAGGQTVEISRND
jgi:hypothetical protein